MSHDLPRDVFRTLFTPSPVAARHDYPGYLREGNRPRRSIGEIGYPGAVHAGFGFLVDWGFILATGGSWERRDCLVVPYARADAWVLVVLAHDRSFWVTVMEEPDGVDVSTSFNSFLRASAAQNVDSAAFGSFVIYAESQVETEDAIHPYVEAFRAAVESSLATPPVDFDALKETLGRAQTTLAHALHLDYMRQRAKAAWDSGRYGRCVRLYEGIERQGPLLAEERARLDEARLLRSSDFAALEEEPAESALE